MNNQHWNQVNEGDKAFAEFMTKRSRWFSLRMRWETSTLAYDLAWLRRIVWAQMGIEPPLTKWDETEFPPMLWPSWEWAENHARASHLLSPWEIAKLPKLNQSFVRELL